MKDKTTAGLLALFLGTLGIHHFYLGDKNKGIIYLLVTLLTLGFGAAIIGIFALIDAIKIFTMDDNEFNSLYNGAPQMVTNVNAQPIQIAPVQQNDSLEALKKYKELLDMGAITEEEFVREKTKLMR